MNYTNKDYKKTKYDYVKHNLNKLNKTLTLTGGIIIITIIVAVILTISGISKIDDLFSLPEQEEQTEHVIDIDEKLEYDEAGNIKGD